MRVLLNSAAYRIAFGYSLAFALATLLLGLAVHYAAHAAFVRQIDASIDQATTGVMAEFRDDGLRGVIEAVRQRENGGPVSLGYAIFDRRGRRIAGELNTTMPPLGWHPINFVDPQEGLDPARAKATALGPSHRLVVAADLEPLERIDGTILTMFGIAFAALLLFGVTGALLLGAYLRRKLARIDDTARAIVAGELSRRMAIGPRLDEFDRVGDSINAMLDRISGLLANLRQVTSDLAHDLRTPLARLRNQLERLGDDMANDDRRETIYAAVESTDDVLKLFDAILRISELEEGSLKRGFSNLDLGGLVEEIAESHLALAEDSGKSLSVLIEDGDNMVQGDRELIAQALINLIENALRHTPRGAAIGISVQSDPGDIAMVVRDNGPGIPETHHARVLERFVRLEASRSTPGHGLGLSLVQAVARAHGASLALRDCKPGLEVALHFPRVRTG